MSGRQAKSFNFMTKWVGRWILLVALLPGLYFSGDAFLERVLFSAPPLWGNAIGYLHEYGWSAGAFPSHRVGIECLLMLLAQAVCLYFMWPSKTRRILILAGLALTGLSYVIYLCYLRQYEPILFNGPYLDIDDPALRRVAKQWEQWDQSRWLLSFLGILITMICLISPAMGQEKSATTRTV